MYILYMALLNTMFLIYNLIFWSIARVHHTGELFLNNSSEKNCEKKGMGKLTNLRGEFSLKFLDLTIPFTSVFTVDRDPRMLPQYK